MRARGSGRALCGWTAPKVRKKLHRRDGGILFIDEAYALMEEHRTFGDEAINTIVQEMENQREDVIVILAGYPEEDEGAASAQRGLKSRIRLPASFSGLHATETGWYPLLDGV